MFDDNLIEVLQAAKSRKRIFGGLTDRSITLIFSSNLTVADAPRIRQLQEFIFDNFELELPIVAGGFGCTSLVIECRTPQEAVKFLELIAENPDTRQLLKEIGTTFKIGTPISPFAIPGDDQTQISTAADKVRRSHGNSNARILSIASSVSQSSVLPNREEFLELIFAVRKELCHSALKTYKELNDAKNDIEAIKEAWENKQTPIPELDKRIVRLCALRDFCDSEVYPTLRMLLVPLCKSLEVIHLSETGVANIQ